VEGPRLRWYYKGFLVGMGVFLLGGWQSCDHVRLKYLGDAAEAHVTGFASISSDVEDRQYVKYVWTMADGTPVRGSDTVAIDWQAPESGIVEIYYIPNAKILENTRKSMLAETTAGAALMMVLSGILLMLAFGAFAYFMEAKR